MSAYELDRSEFFGLASQILHTGHHLRFRARGRSMQPFILEGDILEVAPVADHRFRWGDVLLAEVNEDRLLAHRVIKTDRFKGSDKYLLKGDACPNPDGWFDAKKILGRVVIVERGGRQVKLTSLFQISLARLWAGFTSCLTRAAWLPKHFSQNLRKRLLK